VGECFYCYQLTRVVPDRETVVAVVVVVDVNSTACALQVNLDESNINIQTIASSRHVGPIRPRVDEWVKSLDIFGKTLVRSDDGVAIRFVLPVLQMTCLHSVGPTGRIKQDGVFEDDRQVAVSV